MGKYELYAAAIAGNADAIAELEMQAGKVFDYNNTILHIECWDGNTEHVRFILKHFAHKNLLGKLENKKQTALHYAAYYGFPEEVELLIDAARQAFQDNDGPVSSFQAFLRKIDPDLDTALSDTVMQGHLAIAKLLVEADPSDRHVQNHEGKTPMYTCTAKSH